MAVQIDFQTENMDSATLLLQPSQLEGLPIGAEYAAEKGTMRISAKKTQQGLLLTAETPRLAHKITTRTDLEGISKATVNKPVRTVEQAKVENHNKDECSWLRILCWTVGILMIMTIVITIIKKVL
jgi:hypothetical protein